MAGWIRVASAMFVVGWGANQFSPLLLVYRQGAVSESVVTLAFGAYAFGLVPMLLLAVPLARRFGRATTIRAALAVSAVASLILLTGGDRTWALVIGRLLAGVASGAGFGPGTAWVKDLSAHTASGTGARRAAVALSAGFGGGPLVAGALAEWAPAPEVIPYAVHLFLAAGATWLVWNAPGGAPPSQRRDGSEPPRLGTVFAHRGFRYQVAPTAPLVFGAATTSFAVLPALVPVHGPSIAGSGAVAGLTLASGVAVQPLARRIAKRSHHVIRHCGLVAAAGGFLLAAAAVRLGDPIVLVPTSIVLGACYGMLMVSGLSQVEALKAPHDLVGAAVFYCFAYLGFVAPYLVTSVKGWVPPAVLFVCVAGAVAILIPVTALAGHTGRRDRQPEQVEFGPVGE
ncbi:MFS transporter [Streptomyces tendae]|uniref:MFS transporter n=1 Tax=Streptomyces tendae TaxID=1932 RepID=UPI003D71230E